MTDSNNLVDVGRNQPTNLQQSILVTMYTLSIMHVVAKGAYLDPENVPAMRGRAIFDAMKMKQSSYHRKLLYELVEWGWISYTKDVKTGLIDWWLTPTGLAAIENRLLQSQKYVNQYTHVIPFEVD